MNIITCSMCKRPFQSVGGRICGDCLKKIDEDFITVRDYIYENKHSDVDKVSEETGVRKQTIIYLLKEGRLVIEGPEGDSGGVLHCEMCKKPISTGRLCKSCNDKVSKTINKSMDAMKLQGHKGGDPASNKASAKMKS